MTRRLLDDVRDHAARAPRSPAIESSSGEVLRFGALVEAIDRVAESLRARGLRSGDVLAWIGGRTIEAVVHCLAAWRVGATWFPTAPGVPIQRKNGWFAHIGEVVWSDEDVRILRPRQDASGAWIIATSGSDDAPKLVRVGHGGVLPVLVDQVEAFRIDAASRVLSTLSLGFDATLSDWGTALLAGATLVLAPDDLLPDRRKLLEFLHDRRITHADLPPSLLAVLDPDTLPESVRTIVVGGEASRPEVLRRWARKTRVVSVYGPTEATICCALEVVHPETWDAPRIGKPIGGAVLEVVRGELVIGGPLLALGYVGDASTTAERFRSGVHGTRFFSGDLVHESPAGLVFDGRRSRRVKWNGRWLDLASLETALWQQPGVRGVFASMVPLANGRSVPAVWIESDEDENAVRARSERLVSAREWPPILRVLSRIPRGANEKPDRAACLALLDAPDSESLPGALALAWKRVLGRAPTKPDDRFDHLGGDSLAWMELADVLRDSGIDVDEAALADRPVFAVQEKWLDSERSNEQPSVAVNRGQVVSASRETGACLVTGATGGLGNSVLDRRGVRGTERVALTRGTGFSNARTIVGDVRVASFGADLAEFAGISTIVHAAAETSLVASASRHHETNTRGVAHAVELAARIGATLHVVSTLSVFTLGLRTAVVDESTEPLANPHGAYAASKRAGERLFLDSAVPGTLWRAGLLVGEGSSTASGHFARMVRGLRELGVFPEDRLDARFDVTPLEVLADALAEAATHRNFPRILHVAGTTFTGRALLDALGPHVRPLDRAAFDASLSGRSTTLDARLAARALAREPGPFEFFEATGVRFDTSRFRSEFPSISHRLDLTTDDLALYVAAALGQG